MTWQTPFHRRIIAHRLQRLQVAGWRCFERDDPDRLVIRTHRLAATTVEVKKSAIKDRRPDKLSMMPEGLVCVLKKEEVLDLLAYLRSGVNPKDGAIAK